MKTANLGLALMMCLAMLGTQVMAQDGPPPGGQGRPRPQGQPDQSRPPRADGDMQRRPGMPQGQGPGPQGFMEQVERMRSYLDVVDRYARLSHDPVMAGIAAVVTAAEVLRPRGPEASIDYFNKLLNETKNDAVQRAIRFQLIDLYKANNQAEKALEELRVMMTAVPEGARVPQPPQEGRR